MVVGLILAGGLGTRLWPLSTISLPKPFIPIDKKGTTLYQETVKRLYSLSINKILCISNEKYQHLFQINRNKEIKYIFERKGRNTAAAILFAAKYVFDQIDPESILLILPADHWINDFDNFQKEIDKAIEFAEEGRIAILGARPDRPETGYGYIECKGNVVTGFTEKPDILLANKLINKGALWNMGIFCMKCSTILKEANEFCHNLLDCILKKEYKFNNGDVYIDYGNCQDISIDKAIMEKSSKLSVVHSNVGWDDVGSFQNLFKVKKCLSPKNQDKDNNYIEGDANVIESRNNYIYTDKNKISLIGIEGVYVISKGNEILVLDKDKMQMVKELAKKMEHRETDVVMKRPWGTYKTVSQGAYHLVKEIEIFPESALSLQIHNFRDEHWVLVKGKAEIILGRETLEMSENEHIFIPRGVQHRLINNTKETIRLVEVQYGDVLSENDIIRLEDRYGRVENV